MPDPLDRVRLYENSILILSRPRGGDSGLLRTRIQTSLLLGVISRPVNHKTSLPILLVLPPTPLLYGRLASSPVFVPVRYILLVP